jgi:uncharacterized protein
MTAVVADTFFWIALTDDNDSAHRRAMELAAELAETPIVTTDEVVVEFLTFFASGSASMRRKALGNARYILGTRVFEFYPRAAPHFSPVWLCMRRGPIKATA